MGSDDLPKGETSRAANLLRGLRSTEVPVVLELLLPLFLTCCTSSDVSLLSPAPAWARTEATLDNLFGLFANGNDTEARGDGTPTNLVGCLIPLFDAIGEAQHARNLVAICRNKWVYMYVYSK